MHLYVINVAIPDNEYSTVQTTTYA